MQPVPTAALSDGDELQGQDDLESTAFFRTLRLRSLQPHYVRRPAPLPGQPGWVTGTW